jgi:hypothetical protein
MARQSWSWLRGLNRKNTGTASRRLQLLVEQLERREMLSGNPLVPAPGTVAGAGNHVVTMPIDVKSNQSSPSPNGQGYTPAQIQAAYGFDQLPGIYGLPYDQLGAGQTIAILEVGSDPAIVGDLQGFDEAFGIGGLSGDPTDTSFLTEVNEHGGTALPGPMGTATEIALDVEWAHAMAPGANILLVDANNFFTGGFNTAAEYAASQPGVSVVSMSYGYLEYYGQFMSEGAFTTPIGHQGVTFVASAGDSGIPPLHPSVFTNVLAVGGTTLPADVNGNPDRTSEFGWSSGGGGISRLEAQPAYQSGVQTWLSGEGYNANGFRTTPDMAYDSDPNTGFPVYDSYDYGTAAPWVEIGGTSDAAPQISAMIAIVDQGRSVFLSAPTLDGPSQVLPTIYAVGDPNSPQYDPNAFQDITVGNNGDSAGQGYDLVTGWGTPNAGSLVLDLLFAGSSSPTTSFWTNLDGNDNWSDPNNWSTLAVPDASTDVVINLDNQTIFHGPNFNNDYYAFFDGPDPYDTVRSVTISGTNDTLYLTFGTLDLSGSNAQGTFRTTGTGDSVILAGGVLKDASVSAGTTLTASDYYTLFWNYYDEGNVLTDVQLDGTLDMSQAAGAFAYIQGNLTLNGTILLGDNTGNYAYLYAGAIDFYGNEGGYDWYDDNRDIISGTGSIEFGTGSGTSYLLYDGSLGEDAGATFSIDTPISSGVSVIGGQSSIIESEFSNATTMSTFGPISDSISGGSLTINSTNLVLDINTQLSASNGATVAVTGNWINVGTIRVDGTSTLTLGNPTFGESPNNTADDSIYLWTNAGTVITGPGATVNLGGFFTTDTFNSVVASDPFPLSGATVYLTGSLDNTVVDNPISRGNFFLNDQTGPLHLQSGYIDQGTVDAPGSDDLIVQSFGSVYLNAVTLYGTLDMSQAYHAFAQINNGLTLFGTILVGAPYNSGAGGNSLFFGNSYDYTPQTVTGAGTIDLGEDPYGDNIWNYSNETLTFAPGMTILGGLVGAIYATNPGTGAQSAIDFQGTVQENATTDDGFGNTLVGTLQVYGTIANYNAGTQTLHDGTWVVGNGASMDLYGVDIAINDANISISDLGSHIYSDGGITDALAGMYVNAGDGYFTVGSGYTFVAAGDFTNLGGLTVEPGGDFNAPGTTYTQAANYTEVDGSFEAASVQVNGGVLEGNGNFTADVNNNGAISPGAPFGTLTITGNYTQTSGGVLYTSLGDHSATGAFGQLAVTGTATLDGTLSVDTSFFLPDPGDAYSILQAGSIAGDFATKIGLNPTSTLSLNPVYDTSSTPNSLTLSAVGTPNLSVTGGTYTYDGNTHGASVTLSGTGTIDPNPTGTTTVTYNGSTTVPVNSGTYAVHVVFTSSDPNYTNATADTTITIAPKLLTVSATGINKGYDGTTTASVTLSDNRVAGDNITVSDTAAFLDKNAGNGKTVFVTGIGISGPAAGNYTLVNTTTTTTANITQRSLTVTATGVNKTYDGTAAASVTLADNHLAGDQVTDNDTSAAFANKNVGNGKTVTVNGIYLTGTDANNYTLASSTASTSANITALTLTVTATGVNKVYDGTALATVTLSDNRVLGDNLSESATANFTNKNVGIGKTVNVTGISLSGTDSGNYTLGNTTASTNANITARALTVTATGANKVYDGTATAMVTLSDNRLGGDQLTVNDTGAAFADKNVGTGKTVNVTGISLSGLDAGNYTFNTTAATSANITPATLTVSATGNNKTYDGNTTATVTLSDNRVPGDQVTENYTAAFVDKNVGVGKTVNVTNITLSGADANNYTLGGSSAATTANITPRLLTVGAVASNKVYDGTTSATATLTDNRVAGDNVSTSFTSAAFLDKNAGVGKTVNVTGISISGTDAGNYNVNPGATTTANITPRALAVTATGVNKTYDGNTSATVTLSDNRVSGDNVTDSFTSAVFVDKNVGVGKAIAVTGISITGADAIDYTANTTATASATITPKTLNVSATGVDKIYDGSTTATVTFSDNRVAGDSLTENYTATFADKNVGTAKAVSVTGISLAGPDAGDYTLGNTTAGTTANITPRALTVTATGINKVYDGSTGASVFLSDNRVSGDNLSETATAAFTDKNVGTGKTVNVTGIIVSGTDAGNYTANTTTTTTANITPMVLTVTATGVSKTYDRTTAATVTLSDNRVPGDQISENFTGATFLTKNAGGGKTINVIGISISGNDAGNYTLGNTSATATANIAPLALTVFATGVNKVYDGTTAATASLTDNRLAGDVLTENYSAAFTDKNVGTGKTVNVTGISLSGTDAGNYTLASNSASTTASITPATLTVSAVGVSKPYDGTTAASAALTDNRIAGDQLTDSYASAAFVNPNVGVGRTINVTGISISGTDANNYTLASTSAVTSANIMPIGTNTAISSAATITAGAHGIVMVTLTSGNGTPTGNALLSVNGGAAISQPLNNGTANFDLGVLSAGTYGLSASYAGTGNFGASGPATGTLVVDPAITLNPAGPALAADSVGVAYNQSVSASTGGTGTVALTATVQTAVPGLVLQSSGIGSIAVTGIPTATGTESFSVTATDQGGGTTTKSYTITVNPAPTLTPAVGLVGTVNVGYNQTIGVTGGTGGDTFLVTSGALPAGLGLGQHAGVITGMPTVAGTYTFTVTAIDSVGGTGSQSYVLVINPASWTAAKSGYSQSIAGGSVGLTTYAITSKTGLPTGLKLSTATGAITGTPSTAGTYSFTVTATTTVGNVSVAAKLPYTIRINPALAFTTAALPAWTAGAPGFAQNATLKGGTGTGADTFQVTSVKGLPLGMTIDPSSGIITGIPGAAATYTFTVTATDSVGAKASHAYTLVVNKGITVSPAALPSWTAGAAKPYSQTISAKGGTPVTGRGAHPYSFSVSSGNLPTGLSLNQATGALTGTPTVAGTYTFTVTATDAVGATGSASYTMTINPSITLTPDNTSPITGAMGTPLNQTITATNGTGTGSIKLTVGTITGAISGLSVTASGGTVTIKGTPKATGTETFIVTATDLGGAKTTFTYTITV